MGYILAALASLLLVTIVSIVFGIRIFILLITTKGGWICLGILAIIAIIYMCTHEPIWDKYLNNPDLTPWVDRNGYDVDPPK